MRQGTKGVGRGVLLRYPDYLPLTADTPRITLGEGDTPLVRSRFLEKEIGVGALYFKLEGCNPTGSFKDRGMVLAVAKALEAGSRAIICASTGNTSASAAAYGARCGIETLVIVPSGYVAMGKLAQAVVYGARIIPIEGNFDQAFQLVRSLAAVHPVTLVNSVNPHRLEGQKTAAFEVVDALDDAPDYLFIPVGNAGNISAYWQGFQEYHKGGQAHRRPKMMGYQAAGAAPIVRGEEVRNPQTIATAIRIGKPASWAKAVAARDESGGAIDMVTDEEILQAYHALARHEGVFGEPASAASVAGLMKYARNHREIGESQVVCVITGTGLKDTDTAILGTAPLRPMAPDIEAVERALGWA